VANWFAVGIHKSAADSTGSIKFHRDGALHLLIDGRSPSQIASTHVAKPLACFVRFKRCGLANIPLSSIPSRHLPLTVELQPICNGLPSVIYNMNGDRLCLRTGGVYL